MDAAKKEETEKRKGNIRKYISLGRLGPEKPYFGTPKNANANTIILVFKQNHFGAA